MTGGGRVFVYGTLMPGEARWPALRRFARSWTPATVPGRLWDTGAGYPAATFSPDAGGGPIPGVLVTVVPERVDEALAVLDEIENEGVLYRRVALSTSAGSAVGYEWVGATDGFRPLEHGWSPDAKERARPEDRARSGSASC